MTVADNEFQQRMQQVEFLLQEIENFPDPGARDTARAVVQALMDLHGTALTAMMELVEAAGESGRSLTAAFARDELVASLLMLYGLHPVVLETRVQAALERLRPVLQAHQGAAELLGIVDGVVRLRLTGGGDTQTLRTTVEEAIYAAASDVTAIEVEEPDANQAASRLIPLPLLKG